MGDMTRNVVFLHPAGTQPDSWVGVVNALPAEATPWLPNLSTGDLDAQLASVEKLLDRNELRDVALVAFGTGAPAAVLLAARQPHRVNSLVLASPLLALDADQVEVTGTGEGTTVPTGDVLAVVEQHAGTPLPRLDLVELREQVAALPTVFDAAVHRSWPRGVVVDVVARTPVAAIESDGRVELVDVEGVSVDVLDEVPEGMARVDVPRSGERAPQTLGAVLTVLAELPAPLRAEVAVATADGPASITLELTDGAEVRWGGPAESALKAAVLEVLREEPAAVYDVTVPRSPTTSG